MRRLTPIAIAVLLAGAACSNDGGSSGKGKTVKDEKQYPPCHPGCFPAGTLVATPDGPRPIETVGRGDVVTLIAPDGTATVGRVESTFEVCNRLVEVRTDAGDLLTTETQPLCLAGGGFRPAGELTAGDLVWRWEGGGRHPARVRAVAPTGREATVFNLVVGESAVFVAGGFLARGKPPADATATAP